jgi:hypothetical protein
MDKFPCLRRFHAARNSGRVDLKSVAADILPHGGHKYYVLDIHLMGLVNAKRLSPFAERRQGGNHPVID